MPVKSDSRRRPLFLLLGSLAYYWRTNLAVVLCVLVGTTTLTGALLVGDSMRGSLRDLAIRRLGPVDFSLTAPRFFRENLSDEIAGDPLFGKSLAHASPVIILPAAIQSVDTRLRVNRINLYGVDDRFGRLGGGFGKAGVPRSDDSIILNQHLADDLGISRGNDILLRIKKQERIPSETLLGRPEKSLLSLRLKVERILSDQAVADFTLNADKYVPRHAFISLPTLQRVLDQGGRVNTVLIEAQDHATGSVIAPRTRDLESILKRHTRLEDYDLHIRMDEKAGFVALQTDRFLIEPPIEKAAAEISNELQAPMMPVLTYLANTIAVENADGQTTRQIPYSTVTALDPDSAGFAPPATLIDGRPIEALGSDKILLNRWAAERLGARVGDRIRLDYDVARSFGGLESRQARFTLRGILPMEGWAADTGLTPNYKGITDAATLADWDPPAGFHFDMNRIGPADEAYWKRYRAAPKAFVSLAAGLELWGESSSRFGRYTSIRFGPPQGEAVIDSSNRFGTLFEDRLVPQELGLAIQPVRQDALAAGAGSTDFSQLFIAFSFFLIAAAAMLVALVFRLGVERRASEMGLLRAIGYSSRQITRHFLLEGAILADIGSALGLVGAVGYAWLMLAGLRSGSWWADAVDAPFLELHITPASLAIGYVAGFLIALLSVAWSIRGLIKMSPRSLLAGVVQSGRMGAAAARGRISLILFTAMLILGVGAIGSTMLWDVPRVPAFFAGGAAILIAGLAAFARWMNREHRAVIQTHGMMAMLQMGFRNATRHRGRSLTTAALIACAGFVIVAVGASRHEAGRDAAAREGGTGGYRLIGEAVVPLPYDLNTPSGREALNISPRAAKAFANASVTALRYRPGDDTSCLNLYQVRRPKILGMPSAMIERGGFTFAKSMAETADENANPWRLLNHSFDDGAVPAIGDANTITYLLKLGLGKDFVITNERGQAVKLRIVGMLAGSVLQGELLIAEERFLELFPSITGHGFLLIDVPDGSAERLARDLERDLSDYGLDIEPTIERLNQYLAVENTYLSTFQSLGGLGLILGTFGLGAVMVRNVLERRGELAILRAVGHPLSALGWMVLSENAAVLLAGLLIGGLSALLAVAPNAVDSPGQIPWMSLGVTLLLVILAGMLAGAAALRFTLKMPLLPALRSE